MYKCLVKVSKPPPEYLSFCQQLRDHGEDLIIVS